MPTNQAISQATQTGFVMTWSASTDNVAVTGYNVYLNGARVATVQTLTYAYASLTCGTSYTVAVEARDAAGNVSDRAQATGPAQTLACSESSPPPAPSGTAHLWVDTNGGTCTRAATPGAYGDGQACGSLDAAYDAANATGEASLVVVRAGSYGAQAVSGRRSSSNRVTIDAQGATFNGVVQASGVDYLTLRNVSTGFNNPDNRYGVYILSASTNVRVENAQQGGFLIQGGNTIAFVGGTSGPCKAPTIGCELNKVDWSSDPLSQPKNVLVDGLDIHHFNYKSSCMVSGDCHHRAMYVNGVDGFTLRNSTFRESVFAPWTTISGYAAASTGNSNILIENNQFGASVSGLDGSYKEFAGWEDAWCQNASQASYRNVTIRFNSFSRGATINLPGWYDGEAVCRTQNFQVYGNVFGYKPSCTTSGINWHHNVYAGRFSGTCGASDVNVGGSSMPFYATDTQAPRPGDYALTSVTFGGNNLVPASAGCPSTDASGRARGSDGYCDAGAFER